MKMNSFLFLKIVCNFFEKGNSPHYKKKKNKFSLYQLLYTHYIISSYIFKSIKHIHYNLHYFSHFSIEKNIKAVYSFTVEVLVFEYIKKCFLLKNPPFSFSVADKPGKFTFL